MSCGVGCRRSLDLARLGLGPAAIAPIRPLAWELPYTASVAPPTPQKRCALSLKVFLTTSSPQVCVVMLNPGGEHCHSSKAGWLPTWRGLVKTWSFLWPGTLAFFFAVFQSLSKTSQSGVIEAAAAETPQAGVDATATAPTGMEQKPGRQTVMSQIWFSNPLHFFFFFFFKQWNPFSTLDLM